MKKIQYNVARATAPDLLSKAQTISNGMSSNPYFPDPSPSLAEWAAGIDSLRIKYTSSLDRGIVAMAEYKEERENFNNLMRRMIYYVNSVARQNVQLSATIIVSAGFIYNKDAHPIPAPRRIASIKAIITGRIGEILVKAQPSKHARFYEFFISENPDREFRLAKVQQQRNARLTGLESGKRYYIKVRGVNRSGISDFSNMTWMFAA